MHVNSSIYWDMFNIFFFFLIDDNSTNKFQTASRVHNSCVLEIAGKKQFDEKNFFEKHIDDSYLHAINRNVRTIWYLEYAQHLLIWIFIRWMWEMQFFSVSIASECTPDQSINEAFSIDEGKKTATRQLILVIAYKNLNDKIWFRLPGWKWCKNWKYEFHKRLTSTSNASVGKSDEQFFFFCVHLISYSKKGRIVACNRFEHLNLSISEQRSRFIIYFFRARPITSN